MKNDNLNWGNVSVGLDNTNANMSKEKFSKSCILAENNAIFITSCNCDIAH